MNHLIITILCALCVLSSHAVANPNIVVLVSDDAGYRTIGMGTWHRGYAPKFHPMARGLTDEYGLLHGHP